MNLTDFEDETKFKKYIKEIYDNDTWLKHKKQLEDEGIGSIDSIESWSKIKEGQLYLMKDTNKMYFYYYHPTEWDGAKIGFIIYVPTEEFKKMHPSENEWAIYYEKLKMLRHYTVSVTKITNIFTQNQLINWNKLPWGDVK